MVFTSLSIMKKEEDGKRFYSFGAPQFGHECMNTGYCTLQFLHLCIGVWCAWYCCGCCPAVAAGWTGAGGTGGGAYTGAGAWATTVPGAYGWYPAGVWAMSASPIFT
jgi:hypothetical protein